jgi:hypothetical protein
MRHLATSAANFTMTASQPVLVAGKPRSNQPPRGELIEAAYSACNCRQSLSKAPQSEKESIFGKTGLPHKAIPD